MNIYYNGKTIYIDNIPVVEATNEDDAEGLVDSISRYIASLETRIQKHEANETIQAENTQLIAALKPFAELAKADEIVDKSDNRIPFLAYSSLVKKEHPEGDPIVGFTWGDVRRAYNLLNAQVGETNAENTIIEQKQQSPQHPLFDGIKLCTDCNEIIHDNSCLCDTTNISGQSS